MTRPKTQLRERARGKHAYKSNHTASRPPFPLPFPTIVMEPCAPYGSAFSAAATSPSCGGGQSCFPPRRSDVCG
jgi:hypothetical protein